MNATTDTLIRERRFAEVKGLLRQVCNIEIAGDVTEAEFPRALLTAIKTLGSLKRKQAADDREDSLIDQRDHRNGDLPADKDDVDSMMQFSVAEHINNLPADVRQRRADREMRAASLGLTVGELAAAERVNDQLAEQTGMTGLRRPGVKQYGYGDKVARARALAGLDQPQD